MLTAVRVMTAQVTGPFWAETQIVCLQHEGSMTWVQCQLGFVGDPCSYQKTSFEKFVINSFLVNREHMTFADVSTFWTLAGPLVAI